MGGLLGPLRGLGRFCFVALGEQGDAFILTSTYKRKEDQLTLGSATPRDCTRMTLCRNLTAANCTPACESGAHMNSMIRLFARVSVSHSGRSVLLVHLSPKRTSVSFRGFPTLCVDAQPTKEKRVRPRKRLHSDFDSPGIVVIQETG